MLKQSSPEMAVLIQYADPTIQTVNGNQLADIDTASVQWDRVFDLGVDHGVLPLLSRFVGGLEGIAPEAFIERLNEHNHAVAARNLMFARTLSEVSHHLESAGISMLGFKGPALEAAVYPTDTIRDYGDLDVLVPQTDLVSAVTALTDIGFAPASGLPPPTAGMYGGIVRPPMLEEYTLFRDDIKLEVRWRIGDSDRPFKPLFDDLWRRRRSVSVDGATIPVLHPVDRLQMLAFHGTKHRWHQLKWVSDFSAAVATIDRSWPEILEASTSNGNLRRVVLAVGLRASLFGYPLPRSVSDILENDHRLHSVIDSTAELIIRGDNSRPTSTQRLGYTLATSDSWHDRLRALIMCRPLHPSVPEYRLLPLPGRLFGVYYAVRPMRILLKLLTG